MADSVGDVVGAMMPIFVLAMAAAVIRSLLSNPGHHSIPWEEKKPLIEKYGSWAVNLAEAVCPEDDVECVRREAERLLRSRRERIR